MGELTSRLFTEGDPSVVQTLENCATGRPSEVQSHFSMTANSRGEHIRRVQEALKRAEAVDKTLALPPFSVNGVYDQAFADAIAAYKAKRGILNFANKIDNIVGIKTIHALDNEAKRHNNPPNVNPHHGPDPKPRPVPPPIPAACLTDAECPTNQVFEVQLIVGGGLSVGADVGIFSFVILDQQNRLSCLYSFQGAGFSVSAPVTVAGGGNPSRFHTAEPTKVTQFGPTAAITTLVVGNPLDPTSHHTLVSTLGLDYEAVGGATRSVRIPNFDTGPITTQGASFLPGKFSAVGRCKGILGADKI